VHHDNGEKSARVLSKEVKPERERERDPITAFDFATGFIWLSYFTLLKRMPKLIFLLFNLLG
jgi:hypothetical protein